MTDNTFNGFIPPKKNFFHMPNEWIDICASIKSLAELKVVQYVLRHTWGFQEYDGTPKTITTDEFMHGRWYADGKSRMDKGTGLSNRSVIDGLNNGEEHGYLICVIDDSDKARIVKSYALKMVTAESDVKDLHSDVNILHIENGCEETSQQVCTSFTSTVKDLHSDCEHSSHRSEKDTKERNFRKTRKERHESTPTSSDTTFSPPSVGDARSQSSQSDTHSQQGDHDVVLDTADCLPAVGTGGDSVGRSSVDLQPDGEIDNTFLKKGQNLPTSTPAQSTELLSVPSLPQEVKAGQAESGQQSAYENHIQVRRQVGHDGITSVTFDDLLQKQEPSAQQNHGAEPPSGGAMVTPDVPPSGVPPTTKGKGKKQAEPAPKCDTREIQRRIDEHRGYGLEERVEIIRERQAVKTWCNLHTLEQYTLVMDGLRHDPYWGKPENYYRIGGLTLLKETGRVLALAATQYRPTLRIVSTTEPPTVSGRPRLEVPPEYLAMMMGAN